MTIPRWIARTVPRFPGRYTDIPRWMGVAWYRYDVDAVVVMAMPLNLLARAIRLLVLSMRFPHQRHRGFDHRAAYAEGYDRGFSHGFRVGFWNGVPDGHLLDGATIPAMARRPTIQTGETP